MHGSDLSVIETNNENQNKKTIAFVADVKRRGGGPSADGWRGTTQAKKTTTTSTVFVFLFPYLERGIAAE